MQKVLSDPELELVSADDTRWTSHYRAVRAIRINLRALVFTLQNIHCSAGDLSSEAGGLLLTFHNTTSILLLFALEEILTPLYTLTLALQSAKLPLVHLPEKVTIRLLFCFCIFLEVRKLYAKCGFQYLSVITSASDVVENGTDGYCNFF